MYDPREYSPLNIPVVMCLACPSCGETNLHHSTIHIYETDSEDGPGTHAKVFEGEITVNRRMAENPSDRRSGLTIDFWCEHCDGIMRLNIAQHKGSTNIAWSPQPVEHFNPEKDGRRA